MSAAALLDEFLDPLSRCLDAGSVRRIAALRVAASVQERIDFLAERTNEGLLNDDERAEYEAIVSAADFLSILQLKARSLFTDAR